jgi:hypothetical protein
MTDYIEQVENVIRAVAIHSPTSYSWFGKQSQRLSSTIKRALTPKTARDYLLFSLQSQLYNDFYCQGMVVPASRGAVGLPAMGMTPYVEALSAANSEAYYVEGGWEVRAIKGGRVIVSRDGLELWARPEDCLAPQGSQVASGTRLGVRFPKEFLSISPGYYMVQRDEETTNDDLRSLVRFYWNFTAEGALAFVRSAVPVLNRSCVYFKLKVLNNPDQFTRCDAAVIYIRKGDYYLVSELLSKTVYPEVAAHLRQRTPAFTKALVSGVALAEDPGNGESFGLHRCRLLADGLICAYEQGKRSLEERLQVVVERFTEEGISLEEPFLNPGSHDSYRFRIRSEGPSLDLLATDSPVKNASISEMFLRTAERIGQRLLQTAIWHEDRCTWLGTIPQMLSSGKGRLGLAYGALGAELYSGTSGVALFLAELYSATEDVAIRRLALAAIQQALARAEAIPSFKRPGLFTGWSGIAFTAARVGTLLGEEMLVESASRLLHHAISERRAEHEFDLISGTAGTIITLMALQNSLPELPCLDWAVQFGDELVDNADRDETGYSWKAAGSREQHNLTGFSHGTAGIAYVLLELFQATGDAKYRVAAEQAFQFERYWFDPVEKNWPDFREEPVNIKRHQRPLSFVCAWCHGAPGIALSRIRAYALLGDAACKAEALTALQTTRDMIDTVLPTALANFSLCHGLAGNVEVLLYGNQVFGLEWAGGFADALKVARVGIESYGDLDLAWPCGAHLGETPDLMLGLAGIGYFYLRLHNPAIPSLLLIQPEDFSRSVSPLMDLR